MNTHSEISDIHSKHKYSNRFSDNDFLRDAENDNNTDKVDKSVYWYTPCGKALKEAMEIMNFDDEIKQKIQEKFEKAIENQFEELGRS